MKAYERLLKYVAINTPCDETSNTTPSSKCQFDLANLLKDEMQVLGVSDIHLTEHCFLYGKLPATKGYENAPALGFIAHIDTVSDYCEHAIHPVITENYNGKDLPLGSSGLILSPDMFEHLKALTGHTLITTDGTTILGADDKAGIAEIMTALAYLKAHPEIKHGEIRVGFGPDEEIGVGADKFDVDDFNVDFAYTVDGGPLGEIQYETFSAAALEVDFMGRNVHPGTAKNQMINALQLAIDFHNQLPENERPENTEGYEGFFHLHGTEGTVEKAHSSYIIRDFEDDSFENRKKLVQEIADKMNAELGKESVIVNLHDQYYNMKKIIEKDMTPVELAKEVMEDLEIKPVIEPIRGGTDGSKISFMGIPTPNLFAGGENMHGRFEFVSLQTMEKAVDVIVGIVQK